MVERIDDDGLLRRHPDGAEQILRKVGSHRKHRVEEQQQPPAAHQVFDDEIGFARGEYGARSNIGNDGTVVGDRVHRRRHDAARFIADLGQRQLQAVEILGFADQHIASAWLVVALQGFDVAIVKVRWRRPVGLPVTGHEADGLDALLEHAHCRIGQAGDVGIVFDHDPTAAGLEQGGVVGVNAHVASEPRLLVEIDGAEREQRVAARGDLDQFLGDERVAVAAIVEIRQRQRAAQVVDDCGELRRRRVAAFAAHVEMHVVPIERHVGRDRDRDRSDGHQRGRRPRRQARAATAQRQAQREHEQREKRHRPGREQETVGGFFAEAGEAEHAERERPDGQHRDDDVRLPGPRHALLTAAPTRAR